MNKLRIFFAFALAGCVMAGCRSQIDFDNIDGQAEVGVGVVLPVGSISFTIKDLLPTNSDIYFDSLGVDGIQKGVLVLKAHKRITRTYHDLDLSQYVTSKTFNLPVHEKLAGYMLPGDLIPGTGTTVPVEFPVTLTLSDINTDESFERLDSARIDSACFSSTISLSNFDDLKWEYIESIDIDLGDRFRCSNGKIARVYTKGEQGNFGQTIPMNLYNFTLQLMKNTNLDPYNPSDYIKYQTNNVYNQCELKLVFNINIPTGKTVHVPDDAAINYGLGVQFINYTAIWGMFNPSDQMRDAGQVAIGDLFGNLGVLSNAELPFADPRINIDIATTIAGSVTLYADSLYTLDKNGQRHDATFNGLTTMEKSWQKGQYLDPYTSQIGDSTTNMKLLFDKDDQRGRIDRLFAHTPQTIVYGWHLNFDAHKTPQIRICRNTDISLKTEAVLPMVFNQGIKVASTDTIRDIDMSQANIDSLLNDVQFVDSLKATDLKLFLTIENTIPLMMKAKFRCLDKNRNEIMIEDANGNMVPLQLFENDTLIIEPPHMDYVGAQWVATPTQQAVLATVNKKMLDQLPNIKSIEYSIWIDDESLAYAYQAGNFNVKITEDGRIKLHIGLTAQVDAILNFTGGNKK